MNIFELLEQSNTGKDYAQGLEESIKTEHCFLYLQKIDILLNKSEIDQQKILKKNFNSIKQTGQLLDKLAELLIAYKFLDQGPKFFDDNDGKPDIYLQNNNKYIEVKRINISDEEKEIMNYFKSNPGCMLARDISSKLSKQQKGEQALIKKAKEHINKAIGQLNGEGIIYLVYDVDPSNKYANLDQREKNFENEIEFYFNSLNLNKDFIFLETLRGNELFK